MENLVEERLGKGCILDIKDSRDKIYNEGLGAGVGLTEQEWRSGYSVVDTLNLNLPIKNQYSSYSCVGQSWSYYKAILDCKETGIYDNQSAKAIYSQISLGYGQGAQLRDGAKLLVDWGSVLDCDVPSYKLDGTTDETWMIDTSWKNKTVDKIAEKLGAKDYKMIAGNNIDIFAKAIKENYGVVGGVTGTNNGTWTSLEPKPPTTTVSNALLWGHAIYLMGYGMDDKGKYLLTPNSWGNLGGLQKLRENWFADDGRWIFNPWTIVDKPNDINMILKKIKGQSNIYLINEENKTKTMIIDMSTLSALGGSFTEVDNLNNYKDNGTMVFVERIIN